MLTHPQTRPPKPTKRKTITQTMASVTGINDTSALRAISVKCHWGKPFMWLGPGDFCRNSYLVKENKKFIFYLCNNR